MKKAYKIAFGAGLVLAGSLLVGSYIARKYIKLAVKRNYKKYSNEKNRNATLANKTPEEIKALVSNQMKLKNGGKKYLLSSYMLLQETVWNYMVNYIRIQIQRSM